MHLLQRNDGVWIERIPVQQWAINEPSLPILVDEMHFVSKSELATLSDKQRKELLALDLSHLYPLGVARDVNTYYMVFIWNTGYIFRKKAKLQAKPLFHISSTTVSPNLVPRINQLLHPFDPRGYDIQVLDHLAFAFLHSGELDLALQTAVTLCERSSKDEKGWLRLGDISFKMEQYKLAMLAYGRLLHLITVSEKLTNYATERISACSVHTEWGHVFLEEEVQQIPASLSSILLEPWINGRDVLKGINHSTPALYRDGYAPILVPVESGQFAPLPSFFRWMVPFQIALSSAPTSQDELMHLASTPVGIRHIITLDVRSSPDEAWLRRASIKHTCIPIADFYPPSIEQVDCIMELLTNPSNLPVLIHCAAGRGRTGTIAACYIATFGFQSPAGDFQMPQMQASQAIDALRTFRPGSIETVKQEDLVAQWVNEVWRRKSILRPTVNEPLPCSLEVLGNVPADADLLVLVGLQGEVYLSNFAYF